MSEISNKKFVNLNNARDDQQRNIMKEIESNNECPFCPENLAKYHKQKILRKGKHWLITYNQWPYEHTRVHLLAIATYHVEQLPELHQGSFDELQEHLVWAVTEFSIKAGGVAMRFGDIKDTGGTVNHLHAHIIVPSDNRDPDQKVRFKIS